MNGWLGIVDGMVPLNPAGNPMGFDNKNWITVMGTVIGNISRIGS